MSCARCGASFGCGAGSGSCWCAEVKLDDSARAALASRYEGCLCPACLEAVRSGELRLGVARAGGGRGAG